jgi:hypothetical protein
MPRAAIATGLALLVAAAAIWGLPYLTHGRDYYATTPQPDPLFTVATIPLGAGQRACMDRAVVDRYSEQARLRVGTFHRRAVPLELSLSGDGYRASARVPATYADSRPFEVAVRPPPHPVEVTICLRNAGARRVALYVAADRTKSRSHTFVGGRDVGSNFDIVFTERRPVSIAARLPVSLQRAGAFRFFGVSPVTLWPLLILFVVGVPLAVLVTFGRSLAGATFGEPESTRVALRRAGRRVAERAPARGALASPWFGLGLVLLAGVIVAVPYVLGFSQYFVMPDELGYMKQTVWFGDHLRPSLSGDPWFNSYAQLGPLLFAPAYGLFGTTTAFAVSHVISALVFVSTAVPVFLLTRAITRDGAAAVLAAALGVAVPWLAMTASLMTEPIAYPAFAWALLAMTRAVERPSWRRDVVALLAILAASLARTQLAVLGAAFVAAVLVFQLSSPGDARRRWATALRAHWPLALAALAGLAALASPGTRTAVLGNYAGPLAGDLLPAGTWAAGRELLAYVVVGIGGLPLALAAAWIGLTLARPASAAARAFAAVGLCAGVLLVVMTGSFSVSYTAGFNDRYLFFLVPVLVVASAAMLVERRPAALPIAVAGVLSGVLVAVSHLAQSGPSLVTPSQTFHLVLSGRTEQLASALGLRSLSMPLLVGAAVGVAAVGLAFARRRWPARTAGLVAGAALLLANLVQTGYTLHRIAQTQSGVSPAFLAGRDWLDREAPGTAPIGAVLGTAVEPGITPAMWWDLDFWSKRLDRLYRMPGSPDDGQSFGTPVTVDEHTGRLSGLDDRALILTTAAEKRFRLRGGRPVAARNGFVVWRAPRPYRAAWSLEAQSDIGDIDVGDHGTLHVFGAGARRVTLTVTTSPSAQRGYTLRATAGRAARSVAVPLGRSRVVSLPLSVPATGAASVRLDVMGRRPAAGAPASGLRIASVSVAGS